MHWQPAVFIVLKNWLLGRFVSRQKASQNRERENPKWRGVIRYKVSEKNFRFDEITTHKSALLILNVSIFS